MPKTVRIVLAVVLGFIVGSLVNMSLILVSGSVIPPPSGADTTTMEGLKAALPLFEPKHFLFPLLAHALGTLAGAYAATLLAPDRSALPAYVVGVLFLLGGVANVVMLPGPAWFNAVDLVFAYLPTAWLGQRLAARRPPRVAAGA